MQAAKAQSVEARIAHQGRASCYASRLRQIGYAMPVFGTAN